MFISSGLLKVLLSKFISSQTDMDLQIWAALVRNQTFISNHIKSAIQVLNKEPKDLNKAKEGNGSWSISIFKKHECIMGRTRRYKKMIILQ